MYFEVSAFLPMLIQTFLWGAFSDRYGRKALLWVPCILNILFFVTLMAWIEFSLPLEFIFAMSWMKMNGTLGIVLTGAYAILTDTSKPGERAKRYLYCRLLYRLMVSASDALSGYILEVLGESVYNYRKIAFPASPTN